MLYWVIIGTPKNPYFDTVSLQKKDVYCGNTKLSAQQSWILMDAESVWVCRFAWLKISLLLNFMDVKAKVLPIIMEHNRICACHFSSRNGNNNSSLNLFRPRKCKWFSVCQEIEPLPPTPPPASYIVWSDHLMPFDTVRKLWIYLRKNPLDVLILMLFTNFSCR